MRIKSISINNYRQYKNVILHFPNKNDNELYVFIGKNGTGKTNILNAINWCLYGEEPHLSQDSEGLPILNILAYQKAEEDTPVNVQVEIVIESDNGLPIRFIREEFFEIKNKKILSRSQKFKVVKRDKSLNDKLLESDKARDCVERMLPKSIREYFFFDGERLDNYFKTSGGIIKQAIMDISKINILFRMQDRIKNVTKGFNKEAAKVSEIIHDLQEKYEEETEKLNNFYYQLDVANNQYETAKKELQQISDELLRFPDVDQLESRKIQLDKEIDKNIKFLEEKKRKRTDLLYKQYIFINSYEAISKTIQIIQEMRRKGEIPPLTNKEKLEAIIQENFCDICGRRLDNDSKKWVETIIKKIPISSKTAIELSDLESPINRIFRDIEDYRDSIETLLKEINYYENHIEELDEELQTIRSKLDTYDIEKIRLLERQRENFEQIRDTQNQRIGEIQTLIKDKQNNVEYFEKQIEIEGKKNEKAKIFMHKVAFCNEANRILENTINQRGLP